MIPNFKEVLERLMENKYEFAAFFYTNAYTKLDDDDDWIPESENETELERIGREIADAFASSAYDLTSFSDIINDVLQETVSELRRESPDLAKTGHWHFFEDIIELEDLNTLLENLNFAQKMDYKTLHHDLANLIIYGVFCLAALGSMDYEQGTEHISGLMQKVRFLTHASYAGSYMVIAAKRTLPALAQLYDFLPKNIIGERRFDCTWFFANFVIEMIKALADNIGLSQVAACNSRWLMERERNLNSYTGRLCMVHEEIRVIFYPEGLVLSDSTLYDIESCMNQMSQSPTKEGLLELFKRKRLEKEVADLTDDIMSFDEWMKFTKEELERHRGLNG
ncbi:hypothetical protein MP638_002835, partial [Amoeboaphelidium occidentale]